MISETTYYLLNLSPLFTALPACTLATKRFAQEVSGHAMSGRQEIRATSVALARGTAPLWLALSVWSGTLVIQTTLQLVFAPVQPHLWNNIWRAGGWNVASIVTLAVAVWYAWNRAKIVREIRASAIAEVEPILRELTP